MSLMGLDIGTTGVKACTFNLDGKILASAYREYPTLVPKPGYAELDSNQVWNSIQEVIRESSSKTKRDPVEAVSVSVFGDSFTLVDKKGDFLSNTILAMDNRAVEQTKRWKSRSKVYRITGQPLHVMYMTNKILWLRDNKPKLFDKTWKFLCWEDVFFCKLGLEPVTDYSLAGRTMVFDIVKKNYSRAMLNEAGLSEDLFARATLAGTVVGEIPSRMASQLSLPKGVKAVTGGFDQPSAALGAGVIKAGMAVDGLGTVECLTVVFDEPANTPELLKANIPVFPYLIEDMYAAIGYNMTSGAVLRWYRDTFGAAEVAEAARTGKDVYDLILAGVPETPSSVLVLPHFVGTGTPHLDPDSKGAIVGLTLATTKEELLKGIIDSITYEICLNVEAMESVGIRIDELRATGGGAKSRLWLQTKADILNKPVYTLDVSEGGCLSAAVLAGTAIGKYPSVREGVRQTVRTKDKVVPNAKRHRAYRERYEVYKELYPSVKRVLHKL
jgi:xylulokinase